MTARGPKTKPKPQGEPGPLPEPPAWLEDEQSIQFWHEYAPTLNSLGLLESLDVVAFGVLADAFAAYINARDQLQGDKLVVYVGEHNHPTQNPMVAIVRQQSKAVRELLSEFGMTPQSRTQLTGSTSTTRNAAEVDPLEAMAAQFGAMTPEPESPKPRRRTAKKATKKVAKKRPAAKPKRKATKKRPARAKPKP